MVKSVDGGNVGHCLIMRHHYMRLMTNLQQPGEQYWLIAVLSHGKSPCASSTHLHRELWTCWSGLNRFYQMTQQWESLGLDLPSESSENLNVDKAAFFFFFFLFLFQVLDFPFFYYKFVEKLQMIHKKTYFPFILRHFCGLTELLHNIIFIMTFLNHLTDKVDREWPCSSVHIFLLNVFPWPLNP